MGTILQNVSCFLINLDTRPDRLSEFIENLESLNISSDLFNRVSAVKDENFGGLGCAKSHLVALSHFLVNSKNQYCMIVEDDFRFRSGADAILNFINSAKTHDPNFKMLLLSSVGLISFNTQTKNIQEVFESQTTAGYIISRDYIPQLIEVFSRSIVFMEKYRNTEPRVLFYNRFAIDQAWKPLQRQGGWYCTVPALGYQGASYSDIEQRDVDYTQISN